MNVIIFEMPKMAIRRASNPELHRLAVATQSACSFRSLRQSASRTARKDVYHANNLDHVLQTQTDCDAYVQSMESLKKQPEPQGGLAIDNSVTKRQTTVTKTMDFRLLLDVVFILFATSNFLTGFGYIIPYIFLPNRGRVLGFDSSQSSWLVSMLGISNIIGRVVTGLIANLK